MNSTLKRQKSISSQAASISAWCAVFDWLSIVAALSGRAPGPGQQLGGPEKDGGALLPGRAATSRAASRAASIACSTCCRAALGDVGEHVALAVRHDGLERLVRS